MSVKSRIVVVISADTEWMVVKERFSGVRMESSPLGEWFPYSLEVHGQREQVVFFHGGWGKIAAAASAQYVIDRWNPELVINLGTCGGFEGRVDKGTVVLADKTIVYDILEQMSDQDEALAHYTTDIDLSWLDKPYPLDVCKTLLVSADKDLAVEEIPELTEKFGAIAGDWESGAIAFVTQRNKVKCLILRGVTDLIWPSGGEAYEGNIETFVAGTRRVMSTLLPSLTKWIECVRF